MYYLLLITNCLAFTSWFVYTIQYMDEDQIGKPCGTINEQWLDRVQPCKKGYYCKTVNCSVKRIVRYGCYNSSFYPSDKKLRCEKEPACPWKFEDPALPAGKKTELTSMVTRNETQTTTMQSTIVSPTIIHEKTANSAVVKETTLHATTYATSAHEATTIGINTHETTTNAPNIHHATTQETIPLDETLPEITTHETAESKTISDIPATSSAPSTTGKPTDIISSSSELPTVEHQKCANLMEDIVGRYLFQNDSHRQTYWECKWKPYLQNMIIVQYRCKAGTVFDEQEQVVILLFFTVWFASSIQYLDRRDNNAPCYLSEEVFHDSRKPCEIQYVCGKHSSSNLRIKEFRCPITRGYYPSERPRFCSLNPCPYKPGRPVRPTRPTSTTTSTTTSTSTTTTEMPPVEPPPPTEHEKCVKLTENIVGRYLYPHESNCIMYWECKWQPFLHQWAILEYTCEEGTIFNEQQQDCVPGAC